MQIGICEPQIKVVPCRHVFPHLVLSVHVYLWWYIAPEMAKGSEKAFLTNAVNGGKNQRQNRNKTLMV